MGDTKAKINSEGLHIKRGFKIQMNKNTQKFFSTCLIATLCLGFVGCAKTTATTDPSTTTQLENPYASTIITINTASDLNDNTLNLGCLSGSFGENWLVSNTNKPTISKFKTNEALVNGLVSGSVDAIITDIAFAQHSIANNSPIKINSLKFQSEKLAFVFNKGDENYRLFVNDAINSYKNDGYLVELLDNYMPLSGDIVLPDKIPYNSEYTTTVKVGTSSDFAPYDYYVNDVLYGYDITLMEMIADYNSWNVEFVDMNFNELFPALENGEIDIIASGIRITNDLYDIVDFSESYYSSEQVILTRK